ncbi:LysR family transcriptional regulator [Nocardia sp. NPDC051463]|uniref:LysR family transcriptional regulator n=1 Tax=Nocardia sp. NPDC051463 TaxID=3154845 RepID=UPI00344EFAF0
MELRQLRYFCAVAATGNLTRAAQGLGLRSPSLSQQIRGLEQELGVELFHRSAAGMTLTAAGRALLPEARVVLAAVDRGLRAVAAASANPMLSIGVPAGVVEDLPTRIVAAARRAGAGVELRDLETDAQVELLRKRVLDAGIVSLPVEAQHMAVTVVSEEPLGVLVGAEHRLAAAGAVEWPDLVSEDLLWFRRELASGYHDAVLQVCHRNGWYPRLRIATARRSITLAELAGDPGLVALRPRRDGAHESGLVWRPLSSDAPKLRLGLVFPRDTRHQALPRLATDLSP